jgi:hypothetical protein
MEWKVVVKEALRNRIWLYAEGIKDYPHYLDKAGTIADLEKTGLALKEGLVVNFYNHDASEKHDPDPLLFEGVVHFDGAKKQWYAILDENSFKNLSDVKKKA